ncbi:pyruvate dehydrogenase complex dihydrolipoamide acetyltransferase [Sphingobium sp. LB126]|uniref:dihydrolipoamide acetyltransferase family protein n=1 Tax=Sphingobium sp. LB126 TaxID=1983755 RepID=UPI000C209CC7|nr:dihydrolipoamide acetyltransferase family protein [Sphingobium sp. LB126]PJG45943.1 pyruvate dehydrogenase complex dihydrolipoamide acetyltransferase [Sphingobium sp. LB126]
MAIELRMPALSPTMEKGNLAKWLVSEGDSIKPGDLIAEIETDKATMELEAVDEGRITTLVIAAGTDDVAVGTVIALLAAADERADTATVAQAMDEDAAPVDPEPILVPMGEGVLLVDAPPSVSASPRRPSPSGRLKVSPLAQRIADAKGMDLEGIVGSGPNGRIVRADLPVAPLVVPAPSSLRPGGAADAGTGIVPPPAGVPVETVKLSAMRRTIARRLTEAKRTIPHFYLTVRCNIDPLLRLREELNAGLAARGIKLSVNDLLMKAMALALVEVPDANVQYGGDDLHRFGRVDIAMAVAIDGGLITPVIRDVSALSLSAIAQASKGLAVKARAGHLQPEDYQGGTASISNLGMFGIDEMFPVINPPQALILGIGAAVEQPWKVDGELALATIVAATGSFDHRAIDGAIAARFMDAFRTFVETPMLVMS